MEDLFTISYDSDSTILQRVPPLVKRSFNQNFKDFHFWRSAVSAGVINKGIWTVPSCSNSPKSLDRGISLWIFMPFTFNIYIYSWCSAVSAVVINNSFQFRFKFTRWRYLVVYTCAIHFYSISGASCFRCSFHKGHLNYSFHISHILTFILLI